MTGCYVSWRCGLLALLAAAVSGAACQQPEDALERPGRPQLLIVIDGLRPDLVTADLTPHLHRLSQRGVVFISHHSVFPTVTRVNAASISTGAYPAVATELRPDVAILWLGNLDGASHASGVGAPAARTALAAVDAEIARIDSALDDVNFLVASDHGFSTHTGEMDLNALLAPFTGTLTDGSPDVVRAGGAIYLRDGDQDKLTAIVHALQRTAGYGAIFTRPAAPGDPEGILPGTLSRALIRWDHPRAADILVSADWTRDTNEHGLAGTTSQGGVAGHGSVSPFDVHATLIAVGPDFRQGLVTDLPTANVDLAPTLLHVLGLDAPRTMQGRALVEALRDGPFPTSMRVESTVHTSESASDAAPYAVSVHMSTVDGHQYLDYAEVRRSGGRENGLP